MRVPDGAKLDPKNALFLSVKIMRIHCKNRVWGVPLIIRYAPKSSFYSFCKKNCFFITQHFAATGSLFFRFKDLFVNMFVHVFLVFFSVTILELCTENIEFYLQNTALSGFRVCWLILKNWFFE